MSASETVLALEIGTSKMQVFVGEIVDSSRLNIVSMGMSTSSGVSKGDIVDISKAADLAQKAIVSAEKQASSRSNSVYLAISGSHISGERSIGTANVSGADGIVREQDIARAKENAKILTPPAGRSYIHMICCGYYLDDEYCDSPLGMQGSKLEAEYWLMHGEDEKMASAMHVVESFGMDVRQLVHSALASALVTSTKKQRDEGVLLLDIGAGATDYALFRGGRTLQAGTVPVGGNHVTNDISFGLQASWGDSEKLKKACGKVALTEDERQSEIWIRGDKSIGDKPIMMSSLNTIVCARLEELFQVVRDELDDRLDGIPLVLLTGGVANTDGIELLANAVFGRTCERARFADWLQPSLCNHEYATSIGLLRRALADSQGESAKPSAGWFSKFFKG